MSRIIQRGFKTHSHIFFIGISLTGLCIIGLLAFRAPPPLARSSYEKYLVGSVFGAICGLGIFAGLFPSRCTHITTRNSYHRLESRMHIREKKKILKMVNGHHPSCEHYSSHVLHIDDRKFCSGCTGMIIGAIIALILDFLYFFIGYEIGNISSLLVGVGAFSVGCSFIFFFSIDLRSGAARLILNAYFVFATALLLIGIDGKAGSLILNLYLLLLIVYWIITRMIISQQNHKQICSRCKLKPCVLSLSTKENDRNN